VGNSVRRQNFSNALMRTIKYIYDSKQRCAKYAYTLTLECIAVKLYDMDVEYHRFLSVGPMHKILRKYKIIIAIVNELSLRKQN
jgi:hypothetical protein